MVILGIMIGMAKAGILGDGCLLAVAVAGLVGIRGGLAGGEGTPCFPWAWAWVWWRLEETAGRSRGLDQFWFSEVGWSGESRFEGGVPSVESS